MRDFSWNVFAMTGDVDAYILYSHIRNLDEPTELEVEEQETLEQTVE
ncbi:YqzL family protein [Paenibacillus aquistagni]|uniref:YqzL-like protein n=1 Tax=Paenibacillus aquistagni TaxID=1852522 RepID=A0A1X7IDU3_9BACL|nr:YqzL family protein [Paenibacillus aquistagni]NMM51506.1 YqzL family protein [Paenibacillus aquistagni]SMG12814.1 YqzL-like protein [Paenibacillus aquistagni]